MSTFPRRSPRFQSQPQSLQPPFSPSPSYTSISSQASSVLSTSHPSPANDSLSFPGHSQQFSLQTRLLSSAQQFNAPLPSPSANDIDPFAGELQYNASMGGQAQNPSGNSYPTNTSQTQGFGSQPSQNHSTSSQPQPRNYAPTSMNGVPPGLPPDFLAEAAKRAQMACLMRDMGDVSL